MTRERQVNLFRYVPSTSPVHRMWAGTKMACLTAVSLTVIAKPTWTSIAITAVLAATYALVSGLPRSVVGQPPRWFFIALAVTCFFSTIAFTPPSVHIAGLNIGIGGFLLFLRFTTLGFALLSMGLLLGWTTELADVGS